MNVEFVIVRVVHIGFGVFWAGSALFMAIILEPRLRALGPAIQRPVMAALVPIMGPAMAISAIITMGAGVYLVIRLRGSRLDEFFDTGWGWAIFIGFVASVAAFAAGLTTMALANRMLRMGREMEGRPPTPEEAGQLQRLAGLVPHLARAAAALVLIAVVTMASARFV